MQPTERMQPTEQTAEQTADEDSGHQAQPAPLHTTRRIVIALTLYAALAVLAGVRLTGRPRLVVWLLLGLFVFKTLLLVHREKAD